MALILVVEDEPPINRLVCKNLSLVGHVCVPAFSGNEVMPLLKQYTFDLILLDIMLPEMDGYEIIKQIANIPVIFLTARAELTDRVKGLQSGADDYIVKPFEMLELTARVEAVLRRTKKNAKVFELGGVRVDMDSRLITLNHEPVDCTPQEFDLLAVLIRNRNMALSREKLLELAWGYDYEGDTRTVDVHIQRLRKKLHWEGCIKTVYKMGYRLEVRT